MKWMRSWSVAVGLCLLLLAGAVWGSKLVQAAETGPKALVLRLYRRCLDREPADSEVQFWTDRLEQGESNGAQVAGGFFQSEEYRRRNLGDEAYVRDLYQAVLGREPGEAEVQSWLYWLEIGLSREFVLGGFVGSVEFGRFCQACGVEQGSLVSAEPRDQNPEATALVQRAYRTVLGRTGGPEELNSWARFLLSGGTGAELAAGFLQSREFQRRPVSLSDYVDLLYDLFLDRLPDAAGKATWIHTVREGGQTPASLIAGFAGSAEFQRLCAGSGIASGAGIPMEGSMPNIQLYGPELVPEMEGLVNHLRQDAGLSELTNSPRLEELALRRAEEIAGNFSHQGHEGGENIARSTNASISAEEVLESWMGSSGHRGNLMAQGYRYTACAKYVTADGYSYWVQVFSSQP